METQSKVSGDGTTVRSYMYPSDLAVWLWTILFQGKSVYPYNVGSEKEIQLADLAELISKLSEKKVKVKIAQKQKVKYSLPERYVPQTQRAYEDLGLTTTVDLETAIKKTKDFFKVR